MPYLSWVHIYVKKLDGEEVPCPRCGAGFVAWKLVGDPATRVGFAILWCPHCGKGGHVSRVGFPPKVTFVHMSDLEAVKEGVPDIQFVDD